MEKLIDKWLKKALITKEQAVALLIDSKKEAEECRKRNTQITLYILGATLIGLGVISFIAANAWIWEFFRMSQFIKIFLLSLSAIGTFYGGYKLAYEKQSFPRLGKALVFLSTLLLGGTYALIAQIYNLNADNSGLMFLWLLSIVPLAYIFRDKAINILSIILFITGIIFYYMELSYDIGLTWTVYIPVMLGSFLYTIGNGPYIQKNYNEFSLSYKIVGLVPIFITLLILTCSIESSYALISGNYITPVILLIMANIASNLLTKDKTDLFKTEQAFILTILVLLLSVLTIPEINVISAQIIAHMLLITIITVGFNYGYKFENIKLINLSTWFLIIYLLTEYCRFGWSFFDKTIFFILGGVTLFGLGFFLERKKKNLLKGGN